MNKDFELFAPRRRPYYIVCADYDEKSAGQKVLHLLCHALNRFGEEAYVVALPNVTFDSPDGVRFLPQEVSSNLHTPKLTKETYLEHRRIGINPITVYPEVVVGNPMLAKSVVRYILNTPGLLGGDKNYAKNEFLLAYDPIFVPQEMKQVAYLKIPPIDDRIFRLNPADVGVARDLILVYTGRFRAAKELYPEVYEIAIEITSDWPTTKADLARLFKRAKVVFVFQMTAIDTEARLCGCAVVRLSSPFLNNFAGLRNLDEEGVAIGWDDAGLTKALSTVVHFPKKYAQEKAKFVRDLESFIDATQSMT